MNKKITNNKFIIVSMTYFLQALIFVPLDTDALPLDLLTHVLLHQSRFRCRSSRPTLCRPPTALTLQWRAHCFFCVNCLRAHCSSPRRRRGRSSSPPLSRPTTLESFPASIISASSLVHCTDDTMARALHSPPLSIVFA